MCIVNYRKWGKAKKDFLKVKFNPYLKKGQTAINGKGKMKQTRRPHKVKENPEVGREQDAFQTRELLGARRRAVESSEEVSIQNNTS